MSTESHLRQNQHKAAHFVRNDRHSFSFINHKRIAARYTKFCCEKVSQSYLIFVVSSLYFYLREHALMFASKYYLLRLLFVDVFCNHLLPGY